jgi:hypothetical protein
MATETIKASFSFTLGTEKTDSASAEIDTRAAEDGGDNAARLGKTSDFEPGEAIAFLVQVPANLKIDYVKTTLDDSGGSATSKGKTQISVKEEVLKFDSLTATATLSKPCDSIAPKGTIKGKWIGNNLGSITLQEDRVTVKLPTPSTVIKPDDDEGTRQRKLKDLRKPGTYKVDVYKYNVETWLLNTPSKEAMKRFGAPPYPVDVNIYLKKDET